MKRHLILLPILALALFLSACTDDKPAELVAPKSSVFVSDAKWKAPKGNTLNKVDDGFQMTSKLKKARPGGKTQGVYIAVPKAVDAKVGGKKIRVSVIAKTVQNGSGEFAVAYSTAQAGNSGWKKFTPTSEFALYSFEYTVPKMKKASADFIGVWADTLGKGRKIIVKSAYVELVK